MTPPVKEAMPLPRVHQIKLPDFGMRDSVMKFLSKEITRGEMTTILSGSYLEIRSSAEELYTRFRGNGYFKRALGKLMDKREDCHINLITDALMQIKNQRRLTA